MMFKRKAECFDLCVLRVSIQVFELEGVVFTDQNAASAYARFFRVQDGIKGINFDMIYADDWRHPGDDARFWEHKSIKCAEVLVPGVVEPRFITGAYVYDTLVQSQVAGLWPELPSVVNKAIFFG